MPSSTVYKLARYYTNICESVFFITTFSVNKCRNRGVYRLRAAAIDYVRSYYQIAGRQAALGVLDLLALAGFNLSVADVDGRIAGHLPPCQASAPIPEITFTDICPWLGLVFRVVGLLFRFTIGVIKSIVSIWSGFTVRCQFCNYTVSQKTRHLSLAHNFTKYRPIFEILSLLDSVGNL